MYSFSEVASSLSVRNRKFRDTGLIKQKEYQTKKAGFLPQKRIKYSFL